MRDRAVLGFIVAVVIMGVVRFGLTVSGVSDNLTKYASMTAILFAGCVYFGYRSTSYRELWKFAYLLILPYMGIEAAAIGYTWVSGTPTIFHAPQYSLGIPIHLHFWGHILGGLTWEPLFLFLVMGLIRAGRSGWRRLTG